MKKIYILLSLSPAVFLYSQINKTITEGILTVVNNEKIVVKDIKWDKNGKAYFLNVDNNQVEELYENSIKSLKSLSADDPKFFLISNGKTDAQNKLNDKLHRPDYPQG